MRKTLVAAVALAPLCFAASQSATRAQETISSGVNTPVLTSTANNGAPGDLTIEGGGSVTSTTTTPAVTLNSTTPSSTAGVAPSTVLDNQGTIQVTGGVNGSTALLIQGGNTGVVTNEGSIANSENYTPPTANGFNEEPYANTSGQYGIHVTGGPGAPFNGTITNTGTISVQGNSSFAVSVDAPINGFLTSGTISITGDNSVGIASSAGSTIGNAAAVAAGGGGVGIFGQVSATGQNSSAVNLQGDVVGRFSVYSSVFATAYAETTRPTDEGTLESFEGGGGKTAVPQQLEQSAAAVVIGGNVTGGIFIGAPPVGTLSTSIDDNDGDGIADATEGTGSITNFGSAPALQIGGTGATTIGVVGGTDTESGVIPSANNDYGLIVRGSIAGIGTYDGISATGLQIGDASGAGGTVAINGGVRVVGSVSADSFENNATAIHILGGATVPTIENEDFIEASVSHSTVATVDPTGVNAYGILVDGAANGHPGGDLGSLINIGTIQASVNGDHMSVYGVRDLGGGLTNVLNEGIISAVVTPLTTADSSSQAVALDLSANTSGIQFLQQINPNPISIDTTTTTSASGVVTTTASFNSTTSTSSTTTTATVTTTGLGVTTTTTTTTPTVPEIVGDVLLGSGTNHVQLLDGNIIGALSLGTGLTGENSSFSIGEDDAGGEHIASFNGALTYGGTGLALNVANGTLLNTSATTLNLSTLNVGAKGLLYAAIDPTNGINTFYNASGAATINGQLGIVLKSPLFNETSYTIIHAAGGLTDTTSDALVLSQVPFLLVGTATSDPAAGTISVDLRRRTAAELGLNPAESSALNAIYASLPNDPQIESAVLGQYSRSGLLGLYDQLLPDYSGGVYQLALAASDAVTRATSRINDIENPAGTRGAWAEEVAFGVDRARNNEAAGYQGAGFGFIGGLETGGFGLGAFGLTGAFLTGDLRDPHQPGDNLASISEGEFGGYWQAQLGGLRADARVAGGYALFSDRREFQDKDSSGDLLLDRQSKASSSGYTATGHFGLGYQTSPIGQFYFRPQVHVDYFRLDQGSYTEHDGGDGFDLSVDSRTGEETSGTASLVTGFTFGQSFKWRPEFEVGYRDVFTGQSGDTTAAFTTPGSLPFTLQAPSIRGGGPEGRLNLKADTDFYELNFEAGAEQRTNFVDGDVRFSVRVLF